jgi:RimJ/RimL family protein N-acetyltransferase
VQTQALYDLRIRTPRLELRLGTHDELVELGQLAERGVHPPEEMPFAVAWTDRIGEPEFLDGFLAYHEGNLAAWSPEDWQLGLHVREHGALVGLQEVFAKGFAERRCVGTGSWLGEAHQGRGIGTEMRAAVLELAFRGLGANRAESDWLEGNEASRRVSEKLGYVEYVVETKSPRGTPVADHGVALEREEWVCPIPVTIERLEPCLPLFGVA